MVVTGVSGSGKSTLMQDVLYPALARHFGKATETPGAHDRLLGADWLSDAVFVDQCPIGKTARSNPASYVGAFDEIRKLFADAPLARERSYTRRHVQLQRRRRPLPDLRRLGLRARGDAVPLRRLPALPGLRRPRFRAEILDVKIVRGPHQLSVADVLDLTVSEAVHCSATTARWWRGCSRSSTSAWTTCAWASRCPRCRAARRSA